MKQSIPQAPPSNRRVFIALLLSFTILITPIAAMAAAGLKPLSAAPNSEAKNSSKGPADASLFVNEKMAPKALPAPQPLPPVAPVITAAMADTLVNDDGDGKIDPTNGIPGTTEKIQYTVTLSNTGTADATGVSFIDLIDSHTTLVGGSLNTQPLAAIDSYTASGNIPVSLAAPGVLTNDVDPDNGTNSGLTVTEVQGSGANVGVATNATATGRGGVKGSVTLNANGSFTYDPPPGFEGSDTFTYKISDGTATDTATVTITISGMVWFIKNTGGGLNLGTFSNPFTTIATFNTANAATGAAPDPKNGDFISLRTGTYSEADGLNLRNTQKLIGEAVQFSTVFTADANSSSAYASFAGATAAAPTINATAGNGIDLATSNTVRGLNVGNTPGFFDFNGGAVGSPVINTVNVTGTGGAMNVSTSGTFGATVSFGTLESSSSPGANINLVGVTGTLGISSGGAGLTGSAASSNAINISGGSVSFTYPGNVTKASLGSLLNVSGGHSGTLTFNTGTLSATAGTGLQFDNADGTYNLNGTNTLNSGDAGVDILNGSGGTFSFSSNSSITSPTGTAFNVTGASNNPTITYSGSITQNNAQRVVNIDGTTGNTITFNTGTITGGASSTGININAANGNVSFANLTLGTSGSRMTNQAVTITGGTGTYSLGAVSIFTSGAQGIVASNADGTLNSTSGTVDASSATAINIDGPGGLSTLGMSLTKVSSSSPTTHGIFIQDTNGNLTVNGTGSAGTGGTISNATQRGARFSNATNISLNWMTFTNNGTDQGTCGDVGAVSTNNTDCGAGVDLQNVSTVTINNTTVTGGTQQGINGNTVSALTMNNTDVTGAGGETFENGVTFVNLTGTCNVTNGDFTNSFSRQWEIQNFSGTMNLTVSGGSFNYSSPAVGTNAYGFHISAQGTAVSTVTITGAQFVNNFSAGFRSDSADTATVNANIGNDATPALGNTFTNNGISCQILINNASDTNFDLGRNTMTQAGLAAGATNVIIRKGSGTTGTVDGQIVANNIGDATTNSGSGCGACNGISLQNDGNSGDFIVDVTNNVIQHVRQRGIELLPGFSDRSKVIIQGNTISNPDQATGIGEAIFLESGINSGDTTTVCATIGGAGALKNTISGAWNTAGGTGAIRVRNRFATIFDLPGYGGAGNDTTAVAAFISGNNTMGGNTATATINGNTFGNACPFLLLAPGGVMATSGATAPYFVAFNLDQYLLSDFATSAVGTIPPRSAMADGAFSAEGTNATLVINAPGIVTNSLSQQQLDSIVSAAIDRWSVAGLTAQQAFTLRSTKFEVADLSGSSLGETERNRILVDKNAEGKGWFVDPNPLSDASFTHPASKTRFYTDSWSAPAGHVDLLTAIEHEMGHKLGLDDSYAEKDRDNIMYGYLTVGERRLPARGQATGAQSDKLVSKHFLSLGSDETISPRVSQSTQPQSGAMFIASVRGNDSQLRRSEMFPSMETDITLLRSAGSNSDRRFYKHSVPTGLKMNHAGSIGRTSLANRANKSSASFAPVSGEQVTVNGSGSGFTLPAGKTITITFQVTLNNPPNLTGVPPGTPQVSNQGTVAGNFTSVLTYDPDPASPGGSSSATQDPTLTPVDLFDSQTAVVSSNASSSNGEAVTFTATVTSNPGGNPNPVTGTVQFFDGVTPITCTENSSSIETLNGSAQATCTTSSITPAGSPHTIKAQYNGDGNFDPSFGTVSQTVIACGINPVVTSTADSGANTLRDALANVCLAPNNTITFDIAGPGPHTITLTTGNLVVGKTVNISGPTNEVVTVSGGGTSRVFSINSGITAAISNLIITGGLASGGLPGGGGGAIFNDHATLTLMNMTISGNSANFGGGVYNDGTVSGSASLTLINSTFSGNSAIDGGGINSSGTLAITNSTISGNKANHNGGGVFVDTGSPAPTFTNVTATNNHADFDDAAGGDGGGLYLVTSNLKLRNTIVAGNYKGSGTTTASDIFGNVDSTVNSSNNLIGTGGSGGLTGINANLIGVVDAKLGPLANNGGPTFTHALLFGSPAIETGSNALVVSPPFLNTVPINDQRGAGFPRIIDSDADATATVDIGAVETPPPPTITPGGPTTFCTGGSVTLTSSIATGNQWYLDGNSIGGATNQQYIATPSGSYTVVVNGFSSTATTVTVNPIPATPTITPSGPTTFCAGGSVTLTSSSASGNQWYLNGNPIGGATNQNYIATASGNYTVIVTTNGCSSAASAPTTVTVNPLPATPTITPGGPTTFCDGGSVTLTSSSATGNQWHLNGNPIGGATNQTYNATVSGNYTVTVTDGNSCTSAPSAPTTVTVNPIPATPTITPGGPTTFCAGGSVTLTSSSASGNQWYLNGNPIGGATNQNYIATASGNYTVIVTANGCSSAASAPTTVTVNPLPATPTITPGGPTTFCAGGSVTLTSSSATGNQWRLNGNPIGGATNQNYIATVSGNYTVTVTDGNNCTSAPSAVTTVTVNPIPATPTITPQGPTTFGTGGNVTLTSSSATGNQWYLNGNPIGGATNQNYVATASGNYTVVVTTNGCSSAPSAPTTVTVLPNTTYAEPAGNCGVGNTPCFTTIQAAINGVAPGGNVMVMGGVFNENVNLSTNVTVNINANTTVNSWTMSAGTLNGSNGGSFTLTLASGDWNNNGGIFNPGTGTVSFTGTGQSIGGTNPTTFNNLTIGAGGTILNIAGLAEGGNAPELARRGNSPQAVTVDATVTGLLTLNGDLTVTSPAKLIMTAKATSAGTGDVVGNLQRLGFVTAGCATAPCANTLSVGNPNNQITITAGTEPTSILVTLVKAAPLTFTGAVQRNYTITPTGGSGITATLRLHYLDAELNGNTPESNLNLRRFNGSTWPAVIRSTPVDTVNNWVESNAVTSFSQWTFSVLAPTASSSSISGTITDANGNPVAGTVIRLSGGQTRKTITDAFGNYRFSNVETGGFYTVTPSRVNYNFSPFNRSFSQLGIQTEAVFGASFNGDTANPLDTPEYFVRQQYVDLLGREPDETGFNFWSDRILVCGNDADCIRSQRIAVAAEFFIHQEFQQSGAFIYNLYEGSLSRRPQYAEYALDRTQVVGGPDLEAEKQAFAESFVQRGEFTTKYQANTSADSFVDAMLLNLGQTSGVDLGSQRDNLIARYNTGASQAQSRSFVLRDVTENALTLNANYNQAFVLTEYFGYLRRGPDRGGYDFWLKVLNSGHPGNYNRMVCSFITSREYQQRFSAVVSHGNGECGQ